MVQQKAKPANGKGSTTTKKKNIKYKTKRMKERKDETKKNHVCRCFRQPLLNALFGAPLAVVTVSSIF